MIRVGLLFAEYLPQYRLLGVDPGYLFVSRHPDHRPSVNLTEEVVETLLAALEERR